MQTIYISGKITGIEEQARQIFADVTAQLTQQGFNVINPMALPHLHDKEWHSYMKEDIKALCDCDAILMLHNWQDSPGAKLEYTIAKALGITIYLEKEIEPRLIKV